MRVRCQTNQAMELDSASGRKASSSAVRPFTAGCTSSRILSKASARMSLLLVTGPLLSTRTVGAAGPGRTWADPSQPREGLSQPVELRSFGARRRVLGIEPAADQADERLGGEDQIRVRTGHAVVQPDRVRGQDHRHATVGSVELDVDLGVEA